MLLIMRPKLPTTVKLRFRKALFWMVVVLLLILKQIGPADSQQICAEAPTPSLRIVCEQLHKWDQNARSTLPVSARLPAPPSIPGLRTPLFAAELAAVAATPYQCMDLGCLCSYLGGSGHQGSNDCTLANGQALRKAIRKEYRMLTDDERRRFHAALRSIKQSGEYDRIAAIHAQYAVSGSAHSGPGFMPWHREFLKRVEIALRQVDPSVAIPYWDSVLDSNLPNPRHSIMWSEEFMGDTDRVGNVATGEFAEWRTLSGRPNIVRRVGGQGTLFREIEIAWALRQTEVETILAFTVPQIGCPVQTSWNVLEYTHGNVHIFMGGDMLDQSTSANDPIFFLHHSFVDLIWELWRQQHQSRSERETAYPMDNQRCASPQHFASAMMRPFEPWRNNDGLSNKYTDNMYLFCDRSHGGPKCVAKARPGGTCAGFNSGEDVCYNGACIGGRCVSSAKLTALTTTTISLPLTHSTSPATATQTPSRPVHVACYNEHECCAVWSAKGECHRNPPYMTAYCKASCNLCQPIYDPEIECSNRHPNCANWAQTGECHNNPLWMAENCRQSCGKCARSRKRLCGGGRGDETEETKEPNNERTTALTTTTVPPTPTMSQTKEEDGGDDEELMATCKSPGCYNEHICCQFWGSHGECPRNPLWMGCNCRVSCGNCISRDYEYGECADYHPECRIWARGGECKRNAWMLENCRKSCKTCLSPLELRQMCRGPATNLDAAVRQPVTRVSRHSYYRRMFLAGLRLRNQGTGVVRSRRNLIGAGNGNFTSAMIAGKVPIPPSLGMPEL